VRTTVDLPDTLHARVKSYARTHRESVTAVVASLVAKGIDELTRPPEPDIDPRSGFPVAHYGTRVTSAEVADLLDED